MLNISPKIRRRLIKITAISCAVIIVLYVGLAALGSFLIMYVPRTLLDDSPASVGLNYEDVSFPSRTDYLSLKGWYIPGQGDSLIIMVHGGFRPRIDDNVDTLGLTRDLVARGYDVLLFDLRGRGESEGKGLTLSNVVEDIGGAVDYAVARGFSRDNIGLLGFCSGAASICIFAGQEDIGAMVLDGCSATVRNMLTAQAKDKGIPKFLLDFFVPGLRLGVKTFYDFEPADPIDFIGDATCPVFFIHEELDTQVSLEEMNQLLVESNNPANEIWQVPDALHSHAYKIHPLEYVDNLDDFFAEALN